MAIITQKQIKDYWDLSIGELFDMIDDLKDKVRTLESKKLYRVYPSWSIEEKRLRKTYWNMIARCNYTKNKDYKNYWWRGIKCEWKSFEEFYRDMWDRPEWTSIDRIDNDWNYCKGNCVWATRDKQNTNTRSNIIYNWRCVSQWADELWVNRELIYQRLKRWWDIKDAIFTPR
jgi:hypothetical protein